MVDLHGLRVLVTRPGERGAELRDAIQAAGGAAVLFPALSIEAVSDSAALRNLAKAFPRELLSVFISPNAAYFGKQWLDGAALWTTVAGNRVAAVGEGTAAVLRDLGIRDPLVPSAGAGAAALLESPALRRLQGTHVVVFRGQGGNAELLEALAERGSKVSCAEVYRRVRPTVRLKVQQLKGIDIVTTSSREGLENLYALADPGAGALLRELPLMVSSEAAAHSARAHGQQISPIISPCLSNRCVLEELARWRNNPNRRKTRVKTS